MNRNKIKTTNKRAIKKIPLTRNNPFSNPDQKPVTKNKKKQDLPKWIDNFDKEEV